MSLLCTNRLNSGLIFRPTQPVLHFMTQNFEVGPRKYNPKRHEGYVTMDMVGREEWGAMDSAYYVEVDGKRIPNKWDNKVDPNKAFFGEL